MNIELTMKRIAKKHGFDFAWEQTAYDTRRDVIPCGSYRELAYIRSVLRRVKGLTVTDWKCFDGVFEGYVYVMDSTEAARLHEEQAAEQARLDVWWTRCKVHCDRAHDGAPEIAHFSRCIFG